MTKLKVFFFALFSIVLFTQCETDDMTEPSTIKGDLQVEITDAPIDDANVKGVFVSIAEVKVDGETFSGFSGKTTIDIMAYQNGQTELLGLAELEAGTYSNISLVLDYESDMDGNSPGCYVWTAADQKESLEASANSNNEIVISSAFEIKENTKTSLVADFDLRKSIRYEDNSKDRYSFVTSAEMNTALRLSNKETAGTASGKCTDVFSGSDKIVVYAYKKGSYNRDTEVKGQGSSSIEFKNATTSSEVDASGNFQLSFLDSGEYEFVFAAYEDQGNDGSYDLAGTLEVGLGLGLELLGVVSVDAGANVNLDVLVTGIIPL